MRNVLACIFIAIIPISVNAQYYNGYLQLDGSGTLTPFINSSTTLPNSNIAYALSMYDSTRIHPTNTVFHTPNGANYYGTGILIVRPDKTIAWNHSWIPMTNLANEQIAINKILSDPNGNIYIGGTYQGEVDLDPSAGTHIVTPFDLTHQQSFIAKFDINGNYLWSRNIESANTLSSVSNITDANILHNGNICFTGYFRGTVDFDPSLSFQYLTAANNNAKPFMLVLDTTGNFVSVRTNATGNIPNAQTLFSAYKVSNSGDTYLLYRVTDSVDVDFGMNSLFFSNPTPYVLAKYDTSMNLIWAHGLQPNVVNANMDTTQGTAIYVFGEFVGNTTLSNNSAVTSNGFEDIYYEKWDSTGTCLWAKSMGGTDFDYISGVKEYAGNLYLLYSYSNSINTNTGSNDITLSAGNSADIALSMLDLNANHLGSREIKSTASVWLQRNGFTLDGNLLNLNIRPYHAVDIAPGQISVVLNPQWNTPRSSVVVQWGLTSPLSLSPIDNFNSSFLYPNPASDILYINLISSQALSIWNMAGQRIKTFYGKEGLNKVNISDLAIGTYSLKGSINDKPRFSQFTIFR